MAAVSPKSKVPGPRSPALNSREEVEVDLGLLAADVHLLADNEKRLALRLTQLRAEYDPIRKELAQKIADREKQIEDWAGKNAGEFEAKKTLHLRHGTIGFRCSPPALKVRSGLDWDRVLDRLGVKRFIRFIRTKQEVNKDLLLRAALDEHSPLTQTDLEDIGVKVVQEERFYLELKQS